MQIILFIKKQFLTRDIELVITYYYLDTFGSDSVYLFPKIMREVKVTTICYHRIKHSSFPSLCIIENHGTVIRIPSKV